MTANLQYGTRRKIFAATVDHTPIYVRKKVGFGRSVDIRV
jgi:hypothetical protein